MICIWSGNDSIFDLSSNSMDKHTNEFCVTYSTRIYSTCLSISFRSWFGSKSSTVSNSDITSCNSESKRIKTHTVSVTLFNVVCFKLWPMRIRSHLIFVISVSFHILLYIYPYITGAKKVGPEGHIFLRTRIYIIACSIYLFRLDLLI